MHILVKQKIDVICVTSVVFHKDSAKSRAHLHAESCKLKENRTAQGVLSWSRRTFKQTPVLQQVILTV